MAGIDPIRVVVTGYPLGVVLARTLRLGMDTQGAECCC